MFERIRYPKVPVFGHARSSGLAACRSTPAVASRFQAHTKKGTMMTDTMMDPSLDELGPVDYVVVEFRQGRPTSPVRW